MSLLSLSLVACGAVEGTTEPSGLGSSEAAIVSAVESYTDAELEALAASPAIEALSMPFNAAPPRTGAEYVAMSDGTRIAVSLYLPPDLLSSGRRAPVIYVETWYGREAEARGTPIQLYLDAGFAVAIVDPRGFGASFGSQPALMNQRVREDEKEIIAWLASRPWSNGDVIALGFSASANNADLMAASGSPHLRAAVLRAEDFDHYDYNLFPGGVPNLPIHALVRFLMDWMHGDLCPDVTACGFPPVDGDHDASLLRAAFQDHAGNLTSDAFASLVYKDDGIGEGTFRALSSSGAIEKLRAARVPARVRGGWLDGTTAQSALARFAALPGVPMEVVIGSTTHAGGLDTDPYSIEPFQPAHPAAPDQYLSDLRFVQRVLKGEAIGRSIRYVVQGTDEWRRTDVWPPRGVRPHTLHLSRVGLTEHAPRVADERTYVVDQEATTGKFNRWAGQENSPIYYGDRADDDRRLLTFDAAPVASDMELVGNPEVCLSMRTDQTDGLVIAYLEDVAPNGRVTYLTEGQLRLIHRGTQGAPCDPSPGTARTFTRADSAPVRVGERLRIEIPLWPTAAVIRKGHRLRLSLAGADAGTFPTLTDAPATWSIQTGRRGSWLLVPMRAWSHPSLDIR